jgi:hypothetical protein
MERGLTREKGACGKLPFRELCKTGEAGKPQTNINRHNARLSFNEIILPGVTKPDFKLRIRFLPKPKLLFDGRKPGFDQKRIHGVLRGLLACDKFFGGWGRNDRTC